MAAVNITITGVICDLYGRTITGPVKIVGEAVYSDRGVGGGPIIPPPNGGSGGPPSDAHPEHPIYLPPGIWPDPPEGTAPHPEHPIVIPPPEGLPDGTPPVEVKTIWTPEDGWQIVLVPTGDHINPAGSSRRRR